MAEDNTSLVVYLGGNFSLKIVQLKLYFYEKVVYFNLTFSILASTGRLSVIICSIEKVLKRNAPISV